MEHFWINARCFWDSTLCWQTFADYLSSLDFADAPDYEFLEELLNTWQLKEQKPVSTLQSTLTSLFSSACASIKRNAATRRAVSFGLAMFPRTTNQEG